MRPLSVVAWASKFFQSDLVLKAGGAFCVQAKTQGSWDPPTSHLLQGSQTKLPCHTGHGLFFFFFPLQLFHNKWSDETFVSYKNECGSSVIARALLSFQSHIHSIPKYSVVKGGKQRYITLAHKRGTNIFPSYLPEQKNLLFLKYWKIIPRHFITYSRNLNGESCCLYANPIERSVS